MAQETKQNGHGTNGNQVNGHQNSTRGSLYERAVLGFRNYWYPVCLTKEVTEKKPKAMTLLDDEVVLLRRGGKAYALADECAHRGTRLSRGKHEFPGTNTITCRYHGWVYDVTNGVCIAALPDGPESPIIGKAAVRTYPVEERQGMVWVWMGKIAPVPVEEDIPPLLLRERGRSPRSLCAWPTATGVGTPRTWARGTRRCSTATRSTASSGRCTRVSAVSPPPSKSRVRTASGCSTE